MMRLASLVFLVIVAGPAHAEPTIEGLALLPPRAAEYATKVAAVMEAEDVQAFLALLPATLEIDGTRRTIGWLRSQIKTTGSIAGRFGGKRGVWGVEIREGDVLLYRQNDVVMTTFRITKVRAEPRITIVACETPEAEPLGCQSIEADVRWTRYHEAQRQARVASIASRKDLRLQARVGAPSIRGHLNTTVVQRPFLKKLPELLACNPGEVVGETRVELTVGPDGAVSHATTSALASTEACIAGVVRALQFPTPGAESLNATVPIRFVLEARH